MNNTPRSSAIALGIQLGEHAAKINLTQEQVAEKCGYAQGTISRVFAGKYPAKSEVLCAIAEAIGCEIKITNKKTVMKYNNITEAMFVELSQNSGMVCSRPIKDEPFECQDGTIEMCRPVLTTTNGQISERHLSEGRQIVFMDYQSTMPSHDEIFSNATQVFYT